MTRQNQQEDLNNTINQQDLRDIETPSKNRGIHISFKCTCNILQVKPYNRP